MAKRLTIGSTPPTSTVVDKPAASKRPRKKAEQRAETIEQILDVAEDLFSKHGLYGVTLKEVAQRVGVHHTLLNYYFNDKKALFDAVFARRAVVTSELRMKALDEYEASCGGKPTVEGALRAFLDTDLDLYINGGEGWKNYAAAGRPGRQYSALGRGADGRAFRSSRAEADRATEEGAAGLRRETSSGAITSSRAR